MGKRGCTPMDEIIGRKTIFIAMDEEPDPWGRDGISPTLEENEHLITNIDLQVPQREFLKV